MLTPRRPTDIRSNPLHSPRLHVICAVAARIERGDVRHKLLHRALLLLSRIVWEIGRRCMQERPRCSTQLLSVRRAFCTREARLPFL